MEKKSIDDNGYPKVAWPRAAGSYYSFYEALVTLTLEAEDDTVAINALKMQNACTRAFGRPSYANHNGIPIGDMGQ